ncbi:MAG: glutamate formimidoyltransferase [Flavobacteriales bacterium CG_4_9_14_0_2_um_filter_35_242]|nr:glutamate formimidoyltransferase [Zetaproteobacteria bacterium]NDK17530.1 glutamate formimidoyltransferase [Flavobacteriales bacterium]OIO09840.1 MAG: glutamate formimidoyltransferase [Flavobacteriaceae bacterium CG1_02_35_72]PIV17049.1 MAG: glutamate formimidoyltransferase [Flavobacteriales bacterium CG03_land_8_20_14_0_80_35_15]PIX05687.1 MAG: glutamate formimidoyltransferase [Flavobacteriales bacterium CG_4_8_14_3_um_filter_35_10]PJA05356.1 MAG: glutamate formimidoyltransferase [Flavobac
MQRQLIECVPNISEGCDLEKINLIAQSVTQIEGIKLLDIDPGKATNRTVITFVGEPQQVIDAAFLLIKKAAELIDMSKHHGAHPRFGATDVCPLVPISGISLDQTAEYAKKLGKRVGDELGIPVYLYENAAQEDKRKNLASCRAGEYEGLKEKIANPAWIPDFGPSSYNETVRKSGAIAISARNFLIAYNVNLNTTSTRRANAIAFDIREAGRIKTDAFGKNSLDDHGQPLRIPGKLKAVKGIGWYIEEYGIAQISYNLTNIGITPMHLAFDESCKAAQERGLRVTGSELIGLIPLKALLDAADFYLIKQARSLGICESEKIKIAVKSLGLADLKPFNPNEKIIEYLLKDSNKKLINMSLSAFADETASESMAPGGGSIAAYVGTLGISLGTMVANLSAHKAGWDNRWKEFSDWAEKGQTYKHTLLALVDEDTQAFNQIIEAFRMPKTTSKEKSLRSQAIQEATKYATEVPLKVMKTACESMEVMKAMVKIGLQNSLSDAGVGALCAKAAVTGAYFNVRINAKDLKNRQLADALLAKAEALYQQTLIIENEIISDVNSKI